MNKEINKVVKEMEDILHSKELTSDEKYDLLFKQYRRKIQKEFGFVYWFEPGMSKTYYITSFIKRLKDFENA